MYIVFIGRFLIIGNFFTKDLDFMVLENIGTQVRILLNYTDQHCFWDMNLVIIFD